MLPRPPPQPARHPTVGRKALQRLRLTAPAGPGGDRRWTRRRGNHLVGSARPAPSRHKRSAHAWQTYGFVTLLRVLGTLAALPTRHGAAAQLIGAKTQLTNGLRRGSAQATNRASAAR